MSQPPLSRIKTRSDEARYWAEHALAYFECSLILDNSESEHKSMPAITLQAFSAECSLKSLIISQTTLPKVHGHRLDKLFAQLPSALQKELSERFEEEFGLGDNNDATLTKVFQEIGNDFMDSRYCHEGLKNHLFGRAFAVGYLRAASELLIDCLEEKHFIKR